MKTIIRRSVFETNSSSTHSVTYCNGAKRHKDKSEGYTFEIVTAIQKIAFLHCLINNAERRHKAELAYSAEYEDNEYIVELLEEEEPAQEETVNLLSDRYGYDDRALVKQFYSLTVKLYCEKNKLTPEQFNQQLTQALDERELCRDYFEDDVLDSCFCDLTDYYDLQKQLICYSDVQTSAEAFLSDENAFVLKEFYAGCMLINTKETL